MPLPFIFWVDTSEMPPRYSSSMSPVACCIGLLDKASSCCRSFLLSLSLPSEITSQFIYLHACLCLRVYLRGSLGQDTAQMSLPQEGLQWSPNKSDLCYLFPLLYAPNFYFLEYIIMNWIISPWSLYVDMLIPSTSEWLYLDIALLKEWLK